MCVKMDKLDIYNDSAIILKSKIPKNIISWITILIILTILFIAFSLIPFNIYKSLIGYVDIIDNNSYLILNVDYSDFPVNNDNKLYIKKNKYTYKIVSIEKDKLILSLDLDNNLKLQNNMIVVNILKNRTTLFKIIKDKIKKGFGV